MSAKVKARETIATTTEHELLLDKEELLSMLNAAGYKIPTDCEITVAVPGGGDWSNTDQCKISGLPVCVSWKTHAERKVDG